MFRVLVIDDEYAITDALIDLLTSATISVDSAPDGAAALRKLHERPYDMVLLDYMMPKMNGYDTLKAIRADEGLGRLPVVLMSAFPLSVSQLGPLEINGVLKKPFLVNDALQIVERFRLQKSYR